ncbi:MAG: VIT1/CCC1 transporter family protein [Candidatus Abawacabacteria bacterium]|nr:VIT1/CCC1 transporter family protein [Candidatus Abawacabacteria bacterium]
MKSATYFAYHQYRDYIVYQELAKREKNQEFKRVLEKLIGQELEDFHFWQKLADKKTFRISRLDIWRFILLRKIFGLTFTAKFLETREKRMIVAYEEFIAQASPKMQNEVKKILAHEKSHEAQLIEQIQEHKIQFMSNIVLGLNDGLIELTGALVGFSFALGNHLVVALTGLITGIAASLSMAASAYIQARYEVGKDPKKAALYTGIAYIIVVLILVTPYLLFSSLYSAIALMFVFIFLIVTLISFYASVIFHRKFWHEFIQMAALSIGVTIITFILGSTFRKLFGIEVG